MEENEKKLHMADAVLLRKISRMENEFVRKFDVKYGIHLLTGIMETEINQTINQTERTKGEENAVKKFLTYAYDGNFNKGWAQKLYKVMDVLGQTETLKDKIKPSEAEIREHEDRCGPTGCEYLKVIRARMSAADGTLSGNFYKTDLHGSEGAEVDLNYMAGTDMVGEDFNKYIFVSKRGDDDIASAIAKAAVDANKVCLLFKYSDIEKSGKISSFKFFVEEQMPAESTERARDEDSPEEYERKLIRAHNYIAQSLDECVIVIDGFKGRAGRPSPVITDDVEIERIFHLVSLLAKYRFRNTRRVVVSGMEVANCPDRLRGMLPDEYFLYESSVTSCGAGDLAV